MRSISSPERRKQEARRQEKENEERDSCHRCGRLTIVSLGPGQTSYLAPHALEALINAEVVVGYKLYLDLVSDLLDGKTILSSGMKKEIPRCQEAIDCARQGKRVALVSSGDAGIYGMAGLIFDLCREGGLKVGGDSDLNGHETLDFKIEVIPGLPAFNSAASILGAPLMHDFAAISLSDHLTRWDLIVKRLAAAASADFVIALYNPRSKTRPHLLELAQKELLKHRAPDTPIGIVRRAMRKDQWRCIATLESLPFDEVDMQSMVIVGNSHTYVWNGWMVTPRGYLDKYALGEEENHRPMVPPNRIPFTI